LPNAVVDVDSVDLFKSRLDNFWMSQDVKYDYTQPYWYRRSI